ncbi:molybdopterin synthase catalytic subunit [Phycisphaerales bacterium]|jgi:molybdopterin synthase catalytic subunit|nr:molybdopterin synthase catalytic subunit [Phycisphaerales bacterium]
MASPPLPSVVIARVVDGPVTPKMEQTSLFGKGWKPARDATNRPRGVVGAVLRFEGIVRRGEPSEDHGGEERELLALDYQTYDPMAERELQSLAGRIADQHRLTSLVVLHSRGRVAVGEVSFVMIVESPHRAEALAAMSQFIDRLKQDVPIWKKPVWR